MYKEKPCHYIKDKLVIAGVNARHFESYGVEQQEAEEKKIEAFSIDKEKVNSFSYQVDGNTITFEKEEDIWYYKEDHSISIDQDAISTMLESAAEVTAEQKLENVEDISEYGFDSPTNILTFEMEDGTRTITIGMQNEITSEYYIMDNNSDAIYVVQTNLNATFSKSVEDVTAEEEEEESTEDGAAGDGTTEEGATEEGTVEDTTESE